MSCVFQNIDLPPPSPPGECVPPAFVVGGGHTRRVERGVGGQYVGRRKTQLCTLPISNPLWGTPKEKLKTKDHSLINSCSQFLHPGELYTFSGVSWISLRTNEGQKEKKGLTNQILCKDLGLMTTVGLLKKPAFSFKKPAFSLKKHSFSRPTSYHRKSR
jgi:hypothetical protein